MFIHLFKINILLFYMNYFIYCDIIFSKRFACQIETDLSLNQLINYLKHKATLEKRKKSDIYFDCFEIRINETTIYSFRTSTFLDDSKIKECLVNSIYNVYNKIKLVTKIERMIIKSDDLI